MNTTRKYTKKQHDFVSTNSKKDHNLWDIVYKPYEEGYPMPGSDITIRRLAKNEYRSPEYIDFVVAIWGKVNLEKKFNYWDWLYDENPSADSEEELTVFCSFCGTRPIGQIGVIPVTIVWNGKLLKSGWCIDLYVLKDFQRQGIGDRLLSAALESFPLLMSLAQTDAARALLIKKHWQQSGAMIRHRKLLKPMRFIAKKILELTKSSAAAAKLYFPSEIPKSQPSIRKAIQNADLATIKRACMNQKARIWHDEKYLTWRYEKNPFIDYEVDKLVTEQGQWVYVVWRLEQRNLILFAVVLEVLHSPDIKPATLRGLLSDLVKIVKLRGADAFECQTSNPTVLEALPRGLAYRQQGFRFLYVSQDMEGCPFCAANQWKLFAGDCDVDLWSIAL